MFKRNKNKKEKPVIIEDKNGLIVEDSSVNIEIDNKIDKNTEKQPETTFSYFDKEIKKSSQSVDEAVNYNNFFSSIYTSEISKRINGIDKTKDNITIVNNSDIDPAMVTDVNFSVIKNSLNSQGFIFKPYIKKNTYEYYSSQYFFINKLFLDTMLIMYILFLIESIFTFVIGYKPLKLDVRVFFIFIVLVGLILLYYFVKYLLDKNKKTRIKTVFKYSVINSLIIMLNALLIVVLVAFFYVGFTSTDKVLKIKALLIPALFTLNIPLTSLVLTLLSKKKKYYVV